MHNDYKVLSIAHGSALRRLGHGAAERRPGPGPGRAGQNEEPSQVDEVIVTGFRASLANALNLKKNSNLIIESVTAEDMGKFPDQNIAESLQRLPGVQIDRENGQGTKVRIRGLDQNVTVLNNEIFVSGLEDLPPLRRQDHPGQFAGRHPVAS
jgi:iron complex outermembrane receptor protein